MPFCQKKHGHYQTYHRQKKRWAKKAQLTRMRKWLGDKIKVVTTRLVYGRADVVLDEGSHSKRAEAWGDDLGRHGHDSSLFVNGVFCQPFILLPFPLYEPLIWAENAQWNTKCFQFPAKIVVLTHSWNNLTWQSLIQHCISRLPNLNRIWGDQESTLTGQTQRLSERHQQVWRKNYDWKFSHHTSSWAERWINFGEPSHCFRPQRQIWGTIHSKARVFVCKERL